MWAGSTFKTIKQSALSNSLFSKVFDLNKFPFSFPLGQAGSVTYSEFKGYNWMNIESPKDMLLLKRKKDIHLKS